jgi:hypothetical protein
MLLGTMFASRVCAACMCVGVVVGSLVGAFLGASMCELATGLYGYDASLSFIAVYYALCSSSKRKLVHAVAAAAAATLVHVAVGVTMAKAGLPAGTLGFVFATMVVVCFTKGTERDEQQSVPLVLSSTAANIYQPDDAQLQHVLFLQRLAALQQNHQQQTVRAAAIELQQLSLPPLGAQQQGERGGSQQSGVSMLQQV